jgi:tRNA A22 N-methylase
LKLSKRLQYIFDLLPKEGESFWDLYTDHGKLLIEAVNKLNYKKFYGIDQVQNIIDLLYVETTDIPNERVELKCEKTQQTKLDSKNTITLLGVGTNTIAETINNFENQNVQNTYIVSSHKDAFKLREYLFNKGLNFISEHFVQDKGLGYEILLLNNEFPKRLTPRYGHDVWLNNEVKYYKDFKIKALNKTRRADKLSIINYLAQLET